MSLALSSPSDRTLPIQMNPRCCLTLLLLVLSACSTTWGQPTASLDDREKQLKQIFYQAFIGYEITTGFGRELTQLPLRDEPIMHWLSNDSVKGTHVGSVFVWTHQQRQEVVDTIFTWDRAKAQMPGCEEFYSYSSRQLLVRSGSGKIWRPTPSDAMQPVPNAPVPAELIPGRRLQLRNKIVSITLSTSRSKHR